jgi:predicted AAA+ superfamily ATPase
MDTRAVLGQAYRPRVVDSAVAEALEFSGGVLIEGARGSGKTMTGLNAAASYVFLDQPEAQAVLEVAPGALLDGATPRLLDEWQLASGLWNMVRRRVDASRSKGLFLLTGSAVPADDVTRHTGAGRILRLRQRTLTWWEKAGRPAGGVSLESLFAGVLPKADLARPDLGDVIAALLRPGFPAMAGFEGARAAALLDAYAEEIAHSDIPRLARTRHDPVVLEQLMAAVARNSASEVTQASLAKDLRAVAPRITPETVGEYLKLLRRLFVVEAQRAWAPALRSRAVLRTSPKLHLVDPALAAALLGAGPSRLERDMATLGALFESAAIHDLAVFAARLGGGVRHYRDSNGHEIDAVVTLRDGRWGAVEVKLGGGQIEAGRASLARALGQIDLGRAGEPAFQLVVTGTGPTVAMDGGVVTCPLAALAP